MLVCGGLAAGEGGFYSRQLAVEVLGEGGPEVMETQAVRSVKVDAIFDAGFSRVGDGLQSLAFVERQSRSWSDRPPLR